MRIVVSMRAPLLEPIDVWAERQVRERRAVVLETSTGPIVLASPEPIVDLHRAEISIERLDD